MSVDEFGEMSPLQRYVLLGAVALERDGQSTFQSYEVRDFCVDHLDSLREDPFEGGITREAVIRALSKLEAVGTVRTDFEDRSPVGKGRPTYQLAVDADGLIERLAAEPLFADLADTVA
jgi:hypothetical protein